MDENDKRQAVFRTLIDRDEPMSPTEIGDAIDETRQTVKYHLDRLREQGLVINDDVGYRAQPVFTDDEFEAAFIDAVGGLLPDVAGRVEIDPDLSGEEQAAVVFNCVQAFVAMEVFGGENEVATAGDVPLRD